MPAFSSGRGTIKNWLRNMTNGVSTILDKNGGNGHNSNRVNGHIKSPRGLPRNFITWVLSLLVRQEPVFTMRSGPEPPELTENGKTAEICKPDPCVSPAGPGRMPAGRLLGVIGAN